MLQIKTLISPRAKKKKNQTAKNSDVLLPLACFTENRSLGTSLHLQWALTDLNFTSLFSYLKQVTIASK